MDKIAPHQEQKPVVSTPLLFLAIFLLLGALLGGMIVTIHNNNTMNQLSRLSYEGDTVVKQLHHVILDSLDRICHDVVFLSRLENLHRFLEDGDNASLNLASLDFLHFCETRDVYDQVRFLDDKGQERIRIDFSTGKAAVVPADQLQNKSSRPYFIAGIARDPAVVYLSPLDLNVENGRMERPLKPMVRASSSAADSRGSKRGVAVLNFLADRLFARLAISDAITTGNILLLNSEGYWLYGPDEEKRWGFMFEDKAHQRFAEEFPEEWNAMLEQESGEMLTGNGLFSYATIYVPRIDGSHAQGKAHSEAPLDHYVWRIVNHITAPEMDHVSGDARSQLYTMSGVMFLLAALVAWFLARLINRRLVHQRELRRLAHHDTLTGLPNRRLFYDRLEQALNNAERYKRPMALLYLDLDGFKQVNDTLGHDAGDELLKIAASIMAGCCRKSDTLARLGGDVFALILTEVNGLDGAARVADKLHTSFRIPIQLHNGSVFIGTSIGVAMFPDHADTVKGLIQVADEAMYRDKELNKEARMAEQRR